MIITEKIFPIIFTAAILIGILITPAPCIPAEALDISRIDTGQPIGAHVFTLEDRSRSISIDDIISGKYDSDFKASPGNIPNFGFTESVYWVSFNVQNGSYKTVEKLIEIGFPLLDNIEIYSFTSEKGASPLLSGKEITGREIPFNQRSFRHRNFVFPIELAP